MPGRTGAGETVRSNRSTSIKSGSSWPLAREALPRRSAQDRLRIFLAVMIGSGLLPLPTGLLSPDFHKSVNWFLPRMQDNHQTLQKKGLRPEITKISIIRRGGSLTRQGRNSPPTVGWPPKPREKPRGRIARSPTGSGQACEASLAVGRRAPESE